MLASSILDREHKTLLNLAVFLKGTSQRSLVEYDICGSKWKRGYLGDGYKQSECGALKGQMSAGRCLRYFMTKKKTGIRPKTKKFVKRLEVVLFCCGSWPAVD